jgi:hypothetical protein
MVKKVGTVEVMVRVMEVMLLEVGLEVRKEILVLLQTMAKLLVEEEVVDILLLLTGQVVVLARIL